MQRLFPLGPHSYFELSLERLLVGQGDVAFRCDCCCPSLGRRREAEYANLETRAVMFKGREQLWIASGPRWCAGCEGDWVPLLPLSVQGHSGSSHVCFSVTFIISESGCLPIGTFVFLSGR